jgi:hypothetical protein
MTTTHPRPFDLHLSHRHVLRLLAALLSLKIAIAYSALFFLVREKEVTADVETTYGAYLFLCIPFFAGAALLALRDRQVHYAAGAVVQIGVLALFVIFAIGLLDGPGLFEYDLLNPLHMGWWATAISAAQVLLLGLLTYLALPRRTTR